MRNPLSTQRSFYRIIQLCPLHLEPHKNKQPINSYHPIYLQPSHRATSIMIRHFNRLLLLAVSTAAANNQNQCKIVGETALQTILLTDLSCNTWNAQAVSKDPIDWCDGVAMKWCAGDGNHAEVDWKDSMIYKTILVHCPDELPSKRQQVSAVRSTFLFRLET